MEGINMQTKVAEIISIPFALLSTDVVFSLFVHSVIKLLQKGETFALPQIRYFQTTVEAHNQNNWSHDFRIFYLEHSNQTLNKMAL